MEENGRLIKFLYNEDHEVVAEETGNGTVTRYIRGLGIISSDSEEAKTYYHYVSDEQGSITHVLSEDAEILNHYSYDAVGNIIEKTEKVENRFCYNGEMLDPVTQQYYLRARFYNPVIGRFTQEDTYYGDGLNLYQYCQANPVGYVDPSGHTCEIVQNHYEQYQEYRKQHPEANAAKAYEAVTGKNPLKKDAGKSGKDTKLFLPDEYYQKLDANIAKAIEARDAEVSRIKGLSKTQQSNVATVVAGVDLRTGEVYVGVKNSRVYKGNATCAEDIVFRGLGGNTNANIIMTPAIRPRNNEVIPVCIRCQTKYPKNQFVKGTTFQ